MSELDSTSKINKYNVFMGTIMICISYAVFALIMLLAIYFTDIGKKLFQQHLKTFVTTFVIGTVILIIVMTSLVLNWKPEEKTGVNVKEIIAPMSCPDYWKSAKEEDANIDNMNTNLTFDSNFDNAFNVMDTSPAPAEVGDLGFYDEVKNVNYNLLNNKCEFDTNIVDLSSNTKNPISPTPPSWSGTTGDYPITTNLDNDEKKKFLKAMLVMSAPTNVNTTTGSETKVKHNTSLKCNKVYPEYLAKLDAEDYADRNFTGKSNKYRCEYSKVCGVPWTSAGC